MILLDNRNNRDPYINAAIEDFLVRHLDTGDETYVMLYINTPCVVVGKNQCIYREVNFDYWRDGKPVVRRISGGGAVYHDEGNLCFAFVVKHQDSHVNNYKHFNQPIVDILRKANINAVFNTRNDILWNDKKISGNAQFTDRKNIISHGTMLVNSALDELRYALKENPFAIETKAVASTRSSVMNISEVSDKFQTAQQLKEHFLKELPITSVRTFTNDEWSTINESAEAKFKSFEWIWGRNPYTKITTTEITIEIENGIVIESNDKSIIGERFTPALMQ